MGTVIGITLVVAIVAGWIWLWIKHPEIATMLWIFSLLSD